MTDDTEAPAEPGLFPQSVGERLRAARLAKKLELADIATRTRIPLRHLEAIEAGNYSGLPTPTYAVGFAKAYARAVGENEAEIAREVRGRAEVTAARRPEYVPYETDELPRTPSGGVMVVAIGLALLVLVGAGLWFGTTLFRGDGLDRSTPAVAGSVAPDNAAAPAPAASPTTAGQVTLVATDEVWLRVYDAGNTTLKLGTMAPGERYDVPQDANNPMINVGRPDKLQVLLNGSAVAPLGDGRVAIKDVAISAAALQARAAGQPVPAAGPSSSPSPSPSATQTSAPTNAPTARATTTPGSRSVPPFFRTPAPDPTRLPDTATPVATPTAPAPGNSAG